MRKQGTKACKTGCVKEHRLQASEDSVPDLDQAAGVWSQDPTVQSWSELCSNLTPTVGP